MNDVRNLIQNLRGAVDYKEFETLPPPPVAGSWALLDRIVRTTTEPPSVAQEPAPPPAPIIEPEPAYAAKLRATATARSARGAGAQERLSLGGYASRTEVSGRQLPLGDVFARLARGR